jgi:hypothetical protein
LFHSLFKAYICKPPPSAEFIPLGKTRIVRSSIRSRILLAYLIKRPQNVMSKFKVVFTEV